MKISRAHTLVRDKRGLVLETRKVGVQRLFSWRTQETLLVGNKGLAPAYPAGRVTVTEKEAKHLLDTAKSFYDTTLSAALRVDCRADILWMFDRILRDAGMPMTPGQTQACIAFDADMHQLLRNTL